MSVTENDFKDWLQHPVTKVVRKLLAGKRADLRNEWEMSDPTAFLEAEFNAANIANIGWCRGLAYAEQIDYEVYMTEIKDINDADS